MYSNTAFIPQHSATLTPTGYTPLTQSDSITDSGIKSYNLGQYIQRDSGSLLAEGIYNYANSKRDAACAAAANRIFGSNLIDPDDTTLSEFAIGSAIIEQSGFSGNPAAYYKAKGWTMPTGYGSRNNLLRDLGSRTLNEMRSLYDAEQKRLEDAQKDYIETMGALPQLIADSIRSEGGNKGTPLTPEYLEKLTKYGAKEGAIASQHRAALAWSYLSAYMDDPELLQTGLGLREKLLDIANVLSDEKGEIDPAAQASLVIMARQKAIEKQTKIPDSLNHLAQTFLHHLSSALEADQDTDMASGLGRTLAYQEIIKRRIIDSPVELNAEEIHQAEEEASKFAADLYSDKVSSLLSVFREAVDLEHDTPESASFVTKQLAFAAGAAGSTVLPVLGDVIGTVMARGAGAGKIMQRVAGWAGAAYASYDSNLSRAYADAVRDGKINPSIHASIQAAAQSVSEGAFTVTGTMPALSKIAGKATNYISSRAAANILARNTAIGTAFNYLGGVILEGTGEMLEEELSNALETSLNKLARIAGVELTPVQYKMGEALGNMKPHEIMGFFTYAAILGAGSIPSAYASARNFALNSDNLLNAGHSKKAVRDIQFHILQAQDKAADIYSDPKLTKEQKQEQVDKLWESVNQYQKDKAQTDIYDADPEIVRQRLEEQKKKTLTKAELALAIQGEIDLRIAKDAGIIDATAQPGDKFTVTLIEKGGTNADGSKAPDKLVQQEWTRNQLVNYFQIQHNKIYTNALRGFQGLVQAHAAAQTITDIDGLKVQLQELREIPYEAYASLKKHQGITTEYIAELISLVRANIARHESAGMTRAEAEAQPSNFLPGLSLGELLTLQGAAEERRDSAADTTEGKAKGITKGQSVEYGAFNITRADGSILIAYVAGRADVNDILEDLIEAHIKHTVATTGLTYTQLGNTIKEVEKHLPPVTMPDGKVEKLTLLPAGKTEYTQQNIIEAYSKLALANYLYNEQYLPLTQGGHRLLREIGRVVDTARLYKAIGDAWFTYANSEQGKAHLANGGQTFADLLTNAGFKIGSLVANARANAEQTLKVIEGRDFQPDPAQEVKALINRAEAEQQLADINAKQAAEPTTIPASESITGKEITIEPQKETIVNSQPRRSHEGAETGQSSIGNLSDPAANLRNLIAQGKATEKDFAEFFTKHPITHAAAIEQGLVPVTQDGQPTAAYIKGRQEAEYILAANAEADAAAASEAAEEAKKQLPGKTKWSTPSAKAKPLTEQQTKATLVSVAGMTVSKDGTRYILNNVITQRQKGVEYTVSTDDRRLTVISQPTYKPDTEQGSEDYHTSKGEPVKVDGTFPNWRQVVPSSFVAETNVDLSYYSFLAKGSIKGKGKKYIDSPFFKDGQLIAIKTNEGYATFDPVRVRDIYKQMQELGKKLGFSPVITAQQTYGTKEKGWGPMMLTAEHNGIKYQHVIMPFYRDKDAIGEIQPGDIILGEQPTIYSGEQTSTPSMSIIGPSARTWNNYTDRVFYGLYDGMPRVELDSGKFRYFPTHQRGEHVSELEMQSFIEKDMLDTIESLYKEGIKANEADTIKKTFDNRFIGVYTIVSSIQHYLESNPSFNKEKVEAFIKQEKPYKIRTNLHYVWRLADVLEAPELYAAYPQLKETLVHNFYHENENFAGGAQGNNIGLNINEKISITEQKATLLHEVQHLVQSIEGYPNGTNEKTSYADFLAAYETLERELHDSISSGNKARTAALSAKIKTFKDLESRYNGNPNKIEQFLREITNRKWFDYIDNYDLYTRSAGEAEARAVEKRMNMSEEERKNKPFNNSLDVSPYEAVISYIKRVKRAKQNLLSQHGTSDPITPTAAFSIKAAQPAADRFKASPLGHNMLYFIRNEARRYARIFGDKTPHEQAVNAAQSAAAIIAGVDKYLQRTGTESKPVPQGIRRRLQHLQKVAEKYAQIIATGRTRSFKKLAPQEQAELQAAIADLQQQEQEASITDADKLLTDSDRLTKKERTARQKEHDRTILREAAKGRVYATLAAMLEAAADALDTHLKNEILVDINRITAPVRIKRTASGRLKGKMTAPIYRKLEQAIQFMALSPRALETAVDDVFTAQDALATAIKEGYKNLTSGNALLIQLADQLTQDGIKVTPQTLTAALTDYSNALAIYGDIESKNYEQTRLAANALFHLIQYGRNKWADRQAQREAEIQQYLQHFLANTTAESGRANAKNEATAEEAKKIISGSVLDKFMNSTQLFTALASYEPLRPIFEHLRYQLSLSLDTRQKHLNEIREQELAAFGRLLGIKPETAAGYTRKQLQQLSDKFDAFYVENNTTHNTGITVTWQAENQDGELKTYREELKYTNWELLDLLLMYRQEHYQANAELHGFTPEILTQIEKHIGQQLMDYGNAIQQIIIGDGTIPVYEEREGIPMRHNPLYWPGSVNINILNYTREEPLVNPYHPAGSYDFLKARVRNLKELSPQNAYAKFRSAIAQRANYIYLDPVTAPLRSLLARDQFANRLTALIGPSLTEQLKTTINEITGAGYNETSLQDIGGNSKFGNALSHATLAALAGNLNSIARQASAAANAGLMPGISSMDYYKYAILVRDNNTNIGITDVLKLDCFAIRRRDNAYVNELAAMGADAKYSTLLNWTKAGMNLMDKADVLANAVSAAIVYNHKYDKLKATGNYTEDQLRARAEAEVSQYLRLAAQPLNRVDKSALYWQLSQSALGRSILYMGSESINKLGMLRLNYIINQNNGTGTTKNLGILLAKMGLTVGLASAGINALIDLLAGNTPDDDDNLAAWVMYQYLWGTVGQHTDAMPVLGTFTNAWLSPYARFGDGGVTIPGKNFDTRASKLHTMLTDNKTYSAEQWNKAVTNFMRETSAISGYLGGTYAPWQWYSTVSSVLSSLTTVANTVNVLIPAANTITEWATGKQSKDRRTKRSRRLKSKAEATLESTIETANEYLFD